MREFKDSVTHQALPETTETEKTDPELASR
jgi:hypothetical protein